MTSSWREGVAVREREREDKPQKKKDRGGVMM